VIRLSLIRGLAAGTLALSAACSSDMMNTGPAAQLMSVSPRGGAASVTLSADIVLTFNQGMMAGMEQFMALHQGGVTGPTTGMTCNWSDGQRTLTCHPGQPLAAGTRYTVHVGGGMMNSSGQPIGMDQYGMGMGGQRVTGGMMGGQAGMMGSGWMQADGSYGMMFEFTTR
jgi:hypothetical protein